MKCGKICGSYDQAAYWNLAFQHNLGEQDAWIIQHYYENHFCHFHDAIKKFLFAARNLPVGRISQEVRKKQREITQGGPWGEKHKEAQGRGCFRHHSNIGVSWICEDCQPETWRLFESSSDFWWNSIAPTPHHSGLSKGLALRLVTVRVSRALREDAWCVGVCVLDKCGRCYI